MKNSQTQRQIYHKRGSSCNQSNIQQQSSTASQQQTSEIWDNIGLINNRLTPLQSLKGSLPSFKKYQGDALLLKKQIKLTYDDVLMFPTIDNSMKLNSTMMNIMNNNNNIPLHNQSQTSQLKKQQQQPHYIFPSPHKKEIKSDKIKLLVMLSQLRKEYAKSLKPTTTVCILVQQLLEILQKQENIYGDDMKNLFMIINEMLFCVQQDVIECIQQIQNNNHIKSNINHNPNNMHPNSINNSDKINNNSNSNKEDTDNINNYNSINNSGIRPYFEYINIMKDEIERCQEMVGILKKQHEQDVTIHQNYIKQNEYNRFAIAESQKKEIQTINLINQEEISLMQSKIDGLNDDLQRAIKENTIVRDSLEKWKQKFEECEKKLIDSISLSNDYQINYQEYKSMYEQQIIQIDNLNATIFQLNRDKLFLQEEIQTMTPRHHFNFHHLIGQIGINNEEFEQLTTKEKVELLKERIDEKLQELQIFQEQSNNKSTKKKGNKMISISTKRLPSTIYNDEKFNNNNNYNNSNFSSQKNIIDKSPTRKKQQQQQVESQQQQYRDSPSISPTNNNQFKSSKKDIINNNSEESKRRRSTKKSLTVINNNFDKNNKKNNNINNNQPDTEPEDNYHTNTNGLSIKSQILINQQEQIQNFTTKIKSVQQEEKKVQFQNSDGKLYSQSSYSEYASPTSKMTQHHSSNQFQS